MTARIHPFGIRHHGPGSAASLVAALDALDPAAVLIEGAPEAEPLVPYVAAPGMMPPLAILLYDADNPANALFAPFAEFSPEWRAMRWALARGRPVRLIDWPAATALAVAAQPAEVALEPVGDEAGESADDSPPLIKSRGDPLDLLAAIAGHEDGEAWWNALVESRGGGAEVFAAIETAMTALRQTPEAEHMWGRRERDRERWREAHMRLAIARAAKEIEGDIAVVVGAWHVPALRGKVSQAEDRQTVKGLPRVKIEATWVPWTDTRLAMASGYGAGVASPGWYRHLWQLHAAGAALSPVAFAASWQARVANLLREEGQNVASASAIEAARLALTLAALRGEAVPGLAEMRDASLAALCHGDAAPIRLVERRLLIGERVGSIDESVPQMPLARDLERWQRKARLKPEALERQIALDLRSETGLIKSTLLHRLLLIDVPWGDLLDSEAGRGTFRETWEIAWHPELSVKLAEALVHGVTIEQAAGGAALARAQDSRDVGTLADLVRACLLADLPEAADRCIDRLQAVAVDTADTVRLMGAVPPLVAILRYGTARPIPEASLSALVSALAGEINAGTHLAARNIEEGEAVAFRDAIAAYDRALSLFGNAHLVDIWTRELGRIVTDDRSAPAVAGLALRLLHDRQAWEMDDVAAAFSRALTPPAAPKAAGQFVESFLSGGADVIVQDAPLLALIDDWLTALDEENFTEMLPMLRRGFSGFDASGRKRLLALVARGPVAPAAAAASAGGTPVAPEFQAALPLLHLILGLSDHDR